MGNKESQFGTRYAVDGRDSQTLDPSLIRSFTEIRDSDTDFALDKFQIVRILSNLRQYRLLSGLYEKAIRLNGNDKFAWLQFSLSLSADRHFLRVSKILQQFISMEEEEETNQKGGADEDAIVAYMHLARIQLEHFGDCNLAESAAVKAVNLSADTWLSARCYLLLGMVNSMKARNSYFFEQKKTLTLESIKFFEKAIELDPYDDLAQFYCAMEYANSRNLDLAKECCQTALNLNMENPFAIMLMALIFTARKDFKGALQLVINALSDFPTHYGLLVLRLKLEAKYGRVEEALQTSRNLVYFWRKTRLPAECFSPEDENGAENGGEGASRIGDSTMTLSKQNYHSRDALVTPLTPLLTASIGIATPSAHLSLLANSACDAMTSFSLNDNVSAIDPSNTTQMSEFGAAPPSTDSLSNITSSSKSWISFSAFRIQADIWVELAEFFIEIDRVHDVQACVEEACAIYPHSHQALYLKGHLNLSRAEKFASKEAALSRKFREDARNCFLGALSMCAWHCPSYALLSKVYYMDGNLKMAEKMLRDSLAIDPLNFQCWHDLGKLMAEFDRNSDALEAFQTAASLVVNTPLIPFQSIPRVFGT
ncbi:hypothetical protein niasHT_030691 [Heterodera trifolii]|uniref:Uncharacterized protein n=1 Tax=Heterodera trifolii TaxID=157864 RepID=A0ABD2HUM2_9BILA